jgi:adenylate kinase
MLISRNDRAAWFKGGDSLCSVPPPSGVRQFRLILLGAPGVGKGTQGELLSAHFGICSLSMGDVFRTAKTELSECDRSPAIARALAYMAAGQLVPDETVISLLKERLRCLRCGGGVLLDGFPRTVTQAEALAEILAEEGVELDAVLSYELPLEKLVARLSGRRACPNCKKTFHVQSRPPRNPGICDDCGQPLLQREDDAPEAIRVRMAAYEKSTAPLADYYREKGPLLSIDADGTPEEGFKRTLEALHKKLQNAPSQLSPIAKDNDESANAGH